jgi:hypothetical protein
MTTEAVPKTEVLEQPQLLRKTFPRLFVSRQSREMGVSMNENYNKTLFENVCRAGHLLHSLAYKLDTAEEPVINRLLKPFTEEEIDELDRQMKKLLKHLDGLENTTQNSGETIRHKRGTDNENGTVLPKRSERPGRRVSRGHSHGR